MALTKESLRTALPAAYTKLVYLLPFRCSVHFSGNRLLAARREPGQITRRVRSFIQTCAGHSKSATGDVISFFIHSSCIATVHLDVGWARVDAQPHYLYIVHLCRRKPLVEMVQNALCAHRQDAMRGEEEDR